MELLFESRLGIGELTGKMRFVQGRAVLHEEPVLVGDNAGDEDGIDGGRTTVRLHLERATVWAFELRPAP